MVKHKKKKNKNKNIKIEDDSISEIKDKYKFPQYFNNLLDMDRILNETTNKEDLKVILRHDEVKGTCLFTTQFIKEGEVVAYYKIRTFKQSIYKSPTNFIYTFSIYGPTGKKSENLIGDIDLESIPNPENNIPYWGQFINEPSKGQDINCEVDPDVNSNFKKIGRTRAKCDIYLIYKIIAKRDIEEDEELTFYYGDEYDRDYDLSI